MTSLLEQFGRAFASSLPLAAAAALAWGALSVLLSPCHLASIPLVVGYLTGEGAPPPFRRALPLSSLFATGILASIAAVGAATALAGRMVGDVGPAGNYILAGVFFLVGLNLIGLVPLPALLAPPAGARRRGPIGALALGLVLGTALGPCSFAFMAPLLGIAFRASAVRPAYGALLLALYGVGHVAVIAIGGASADLVQRFVAWSGTSRAPTVLRRVSGAVVLAGGAYFLFSAS